MHHFKCLQLLKMNLKLKKELFEKNIFKIFMTKTCHVTIRCHELSLSVSQTCANFRNFAFLLSPRIE